jgi:hypothetical protein
MHSTSTIAVVFPSIAGLALIGMGIFDGIRKREIRHRERMRAMELGLPAPNDSAWPGLVCIAIGAVVPVAALGVALVATLLAPDRSSHRAELAQVVLVEQPSQSTDYYRHVWVGSSMVGVAGAVGGTLLALKLFGSCKAGKRQVTGTEKLASYDPDAYDTVGQRG